MMCMDGACVRACVRACVCVCVRVCVCVCVCVCGVALCHAWSHREQLLVAGPHAQTNTFESRRADQVRCLHLIPFAANNHCSPSSSCFSCRPTAVLPVQPSPRYAMSQGGLLAGGAARTKLAEGGALAGTLSAAPILVLSVAA